jgi:hypothetical protein
MPTYRITNTTSGLCLGDYEGESPAAALASMRRDAGITGDDELKADSDDLDADELTVYQPTPHADRPETRPVLPVRICVWAGEVVAEYADWSPERYASIDVLCREHEMSAEELGAAIGSHSPLKLIASCEGDADGAVLDMLIAHGCPAREDVLATLREGEHTNIEGHEYNGLVVKRVSGGWHLLREDVDTERPLIKALRVFRREPHGTIRRAFAHNAWLDLNSAERDTLRALVERGPVYDGDLPSKTGRDSLLANGLAVQVAHQGEDGFQAATLEGLELWKAVGR